MGTVALAVVGVVHLNLYAREHYSQIPTIGSLFLLDVILAWSAALALTLLRSVRLRRYTAGMGALLCIGTFAGYMVALVHPLFGFEEPGISYSGGVAIAAELLGSVSLGLYALRAGRRVTNTSSPEVLKSGTSDSYTEPDISSSNSSPSRRPIDVGTKNDIAISPMGSEGGTQDAQDK